MKIIQEDGKTYTQIEVFVDEMGKYFALINSKLVRLKED